MLFCKLPSTEITMLFKRSFIPLRDKLRTLLNWFEYSTSFVMSGFPLIGDMTLSWQPQLRTYTYCSTIVKKGSKKQDKIRRQYKVVFIRLISNQSILKLFNFNFHFLNPPHFIVWIILVYIFASYGCTWKCHIGSPFNEAWIVEFFFKRKLLRSLVIKQENFFRTIFSTRTPSNYWVYNESIKDLLRVW